jgi:hypothetical protein
MATIAHTTYSVHKRPGKQHVTTLGSCNYQSQRAVVPQPGQRPTYPPPANQRGQANKPDLHHQLAPLNQYSSPYAKHINANC